MTLTCADAIRLIQSDEVAFDKDFTKQLAQAMSCKFSDQEVLQFWDFLVAEINRRNLTDNINLVGEKLIQEKRSRRPP